VSPPPCCLRRHRWHRSTSSWCWGCPSAAGCCPLRPSRAGSSQRRGAGGSGWAPPASPVRRSPVRQAQDSAARGSFPSLRGKSSPSLCCWSCCGSPPRAFAAKPPSLVLLYWDVSLGSQISCSGALPAASPSRADRCGSCGWLGAACWLRSPEAQPGTCTRSPPRCLQKPGCSGGRRRRRRRLPCRGSGSGQAGAEALLAFSLVRSHGSGVESGEVHARKNQCEGINQAESERLKKSRGSGVMCAVERGFLYLRGPPRLPSCQDKPDKAETFCTPKQIVVCWMGALRASRASRGVNTLCLTACSPQASAGVCRMPGRL